MKGWKSEIGGIARFDRESPRIPRSGQKRCFHLDREASILNRAVGTSDLNVPRAAVHWDCFRMA
jgi:hypothetical protein